MSNTAQPDFLPEEKQVAIYTEAEQLYKGLHPTFKSGAINAYRLGATTYALQLLAVQQENERLKEALNAKLEAKENRDFAFLGPEAEAFLYAVYEGAECWEEELRNEKKRAATQMLLIRDALVEKNIDEAYHQCYTYADPAFKYMDNPWKDLEALVDPEKQH